MWLINLCFFIQLFTLKVKDKRFPLIPYNHYDTWKYTVHKIYFMFDDRDNCLHSLYHNHNGNHHNDTLCQHIGFCFCCMDMQGGITMTDSVWEKKILTFNHLWHRRPHGEEPL